MQGKYPHLEWLDLYDNGIATECAILQKSADGNVIFFPLNALDRIDKKRLLDIVTNRNAHLHELYDLMSGITLRNGVNALTYFHQFAKMKTPSGQIIEVDPTRRGFVQMQTEGIADQMNDTPATSGRRGSR